MVDFDGDGRKDVISGSYSPGYLFAFIQKTDGTYAAGQKIQDSNGKSIKVGYAAHVYAADWDSDEDLDLVVGNINGDVYFVRNEGKPGADAFGKAQPLSAGDERISVGHGDAGPVLSDWDGDGLLDLIVGAGDGSVTFYRNAGTKIEPKLAEGRQLIAPSDREKQGSSCGTRTKVCVTDYNGDGRLDLLVGDFAMAQDQPAEQAAEQRADAQKAQREYQQIIEQYTAAQQKTEIPELSRQYQELQEEPDGETPEQAAAREKKAEQILERLQEVQQKKLQPLLDRMTEVRKRMPQAQHSYHGFVWLYLRNSEGKSATEGK